MAVEAQEANFFTTKLDFIVNWGRKNSLWPFPYGTACCAIEFMSTETSPYDLSRIGSEYVRFLRIFREEAKKQCQHAVPKHHHFRRIS